MNAGLFGIQALPRIGWDYVSGPHPITLGVEQIFQFPSNRPLTHVSVRLRCLVAANGYTVDREIPIELVTRNAAAADDGAPRWSWSIDGSQVRLTIAATSIAMIDSTGVTISTFTAASWAIKLYASA